MYGSGKSSISQVLLSITCGICVFLSIICTCLTAFLIPFNHQVDASSLQGLRRLHSIMSSIEPSNITFRLPQDVKPLKYDLYLHPNLDEGTFTGRVSILIDVADKRKFIMLHQKELVISSVNLETGHNHDNNKFDIEIKESYPVEKNEAFIIVPKKDLNIGLYRLNLTFSGSLKDKIVGFYASKYKDEQNKARTIATSKFEPTYARRSFPCFDEPGFKAEFNIRLVHPSGDGFNALSNMNIKSISVDDPAPGLSTALFAKSVPMSTYLACFIVSDFVAVTKTAHGLDGRTFPISVYTTRAQKEKGSFALDIGVQIIEYYIDLFKIDYPLPKLDMAAIPDFVSGAMENWGLVTYREARLLVDNQTTSTKAKEDIVQVIAHEFAHMWFGNLVTMAWWNDLWLNEGFATYMQFKSSDAILPKWNFMDHFALKELHPAFATDAKLSSHPIVQNVTNPDEITAIFDVISYQKGASILRMLENFVGTELFYEGITRYLKKFAYGNAETKDFLNVIQETYGNQINIATIMDTWTRQMGYPVVNVVKNDLTYTLTQKRFLVNSNSNYNRQESEYGYKWTIPITYITSERSIPTLVWFDKDADQLVVHLSRPVEWIKFNVDQVGYYRVNYDESEWKSLLNVLLSSHKRFSVQDRTHLLEEAFSLADAGEIQYHVTMNMTRYLKNEKHSSPWYVATSKLLATDLLLSSTPTSSKFRAYVRELVDSIYHEVTWNVDEMEDPVRLNLRSSVLNLACAAGHVECLEEAASIFRAWINDKDDKRPHPDIRSLVYYYGMNHVGGEAEWDVMFQRFSNETNAAEKLQLMYGLAGIRSNYILKKYINLAMDENYIRSQDALNCLVKISQNPDGTTLVWDWVRENWVLLVKRYTLNDRYLGQLIPSVCKSFSTKIKLDEIHAFFAKHPEAGAGEIYRAQTLETVSSNIKWLERNSMEIDKWLDTQVELKRS